MLPVRQPGELVPICLYRFVVAAAACFSAFAVAPAGADAWTVTVAGSQLQVVAAPGEANQFSVALVSGKVQVTDVSGASVSAVTGGGCVQPFASRVVCDAIASVSVDAGDGADRISDATGLSGNQLLGGSGNDQLFGGSGASTLDGGDDDDVVTGGSSADTVTGGSGADELYGAGGADTVSGGPGVDVVYGDGGEDTLTGGDGDDQLWGGESADEISGGGDSDQIDGEGGADALNGDGGADVIEGGSEADQIDGGEDNDVVRGQDGADILEGGEGADSISGGDAGDTVSAGPGADTVIGGEGADQIDGGDDADVLDGGAGGDALTGGEGDDRLDGGLDADSLSGGGGRDVLDGGPGADVLTGAVGDDSLLGGEESDQLDGGEGADVLDGGPGSDVLVGGADADTIDYTSRLSAVTVIIAAQPSAGNGEVGEGDVLGDVIEQVRGGAGNDTLRATVASPVVLDGGLGDDQLFGGDGGDVLLGGEGDDTIDGGLGADSLAGGEGIDTASYASRTLGVAVSLDGAANDGQPGEADNAVAENLVGGLGNDVLVGGVGENAISGGAGNDQLRDVGDAQFTDVLSCGAGVDRATGDNPDVLLECEADLSEQARIDTSGIALVTRTARFRVTGTGATTKISVRCRPLTRVRCRTRFGLRIGTGKRAVSAQWTETTVRPGKRRTVTVRLSFRQLERVRALPVSLRRRATLRVVVFDGQGALPRDYLPIGLAGSALGLGA